MSKKIFIVFLLLLSIKMVFSQTGWYQQVSGTTSSLTGVHFLNSSTGFASGFAGTILKTTNGGTNWTVTYVGLNVNYVFSIYFSNVNTGFIVVEVGSRRRILKTTNNGSSWDSTGGPDATIMFFLNSYTGWTGALSAFGGRINKTTDMGNTWTYLTNSPTTNINDYYFINESTGFVCGSYVHWINPEISEKRAEIYRTSNSGYNWFLVYAGVLSINTASVERIVFASDNVGYAIGYDNGYKLFKSANGGLNWTTSATANGIRFVSFVNELTGWIGGENGSIYFTPSGGIYWMPQTSGTTQILTDIFMIDQNTGWIVGIGGNILKTTNGGITSIQPISNEIPDEYSLSQNYPNPFNPVTKIKFSITAVGERHAFQTTLIVYNVLGKEVETLVNESLSPGTYEVDFDGSNLSSGVYYYRLNADDYTETRKMVLIK